MPEFNPDKQLFEEVKKFAAEAAQTNLLESGVDANFTDPMIKMLETAVTSSAALEDLVEEVRLFTIGDLERLGKLDRYIKQVSSDTLNQFAANYNLVVSEDIGLEFYKYTGNLIKDSRLFCSHRVNKYYHKKEVESWVTTQGGNGNPVPHGQWQGMIAGTNRSSIFINRGGWNCRHQLIAVNTRFVPKNVIVRNIDSGNYVPTK